MAARLLLVTILLAGCARSPEPGDGVAFSVVWGNFSNQEHAFAVLERDRPDPFVGHNVWESCASGLLKYELRAPFDVLLGIDDGMGQIPLLFSSDDMPPQGEAGYLMSISATGELRVLPLDEPEPPWGEAEPC